jgi:hypothetical protein
VAQRHDSLLGEQADRARHPGRIHLPSAAAYAAIVAPDIVSALQEGPFAVDAVCTEHDGHSVRVALRAAIRDAVKRRDRGAAAVYRTALGAIDNAEAVPADAGGAGAIESSTLGVGRTEAARRTLSEQDMIAIVVGEVQERRSAAESMQAAHPAAADQLRSEAELLLAVACPRDGR